MESLRNYRFVRAVINWVHRTPTPYIVIGLLLSLCIVSLYVYSVRLENRVSRSQDVLLVGSVLQVEYVRLVSDVMLEIKFNDAVDEHLLSHKLMINPDTPGKLEAEGDETLYRFVADDPFPLGSSVSIVVEQGLESRTGKLLIDDYHKTISTRTPNGNVVFSRDWIGGRVISYSAGEALTIDFQAGHGVANFTATVYESSMGDLLNYLVHETTSEERNGYTYERVDYKNDTAVYDNNAVVDEIEIDTSESSFDINLPAGVYYLGASDSRGDIGGTFLVVSNKGLLFRQDDRRVLLSSYDIESGSNVTTPVSAAFYQLEGSPILTRTVNFEGTTSVNVAFEQKIDAVVATIDGESAFVPVHVYHSQADIRVRQDLEEDTQVFIYTDRPIYKGGDTVFYKGIVRYDRDADYSPAVGVGVNVSMTSLRDFEYKATVTTDVNGNFSGYFVLPDDVPESEYNSLFANTLTDDQDPDLSYYRQGNATFSISDFKKPAFELNVETSDSEGFWHEAVSFDISAETFTGKPLADEVVTYTVYAKAFFEAESKVFNENFNITQIGGMCGVGFGGEYYGQSVKTGEVKLNSSGKATVVFKPSDADLVQNSQIFTFVAEKIDRSTNNKLVAAANSVVHAGEYKTFFLPSASRYTKGEEVVLPFYIESFNNNVQVPDQVTYKLVTYQSSYQRSGEKEHASGKVDVDNSGKGIVRFRLPEDFVGQAFVIVQADDRHGNVVEAQEYLSVTEDLEPKLDYRWNRAPEQTLLKVSSDSNSYVVGDTIVLTIESPAELDAFVTAERGRIYKERMMKLNKGINKLEIPVDESLSPSITVSFSFFYKGEYYFEGVALNVPAMHRLLDVKINPDKNVYRPNDVAVLQITSHDNDGKAAPAQFSLGVVNEAIYSLRKSATPPIHTSFYFYRDRATNASSSLTPVGTIGGGGRGGGGGGDHGLSTDVDTLYWNSNVETGPNGETYVEVKLADYEAVWRAQVIGSDVKSNVGQDAVRLEVRK